MMHLPYQYGSTRNFCGVPNFVDQKFVVIGAPWDTATTYRSGARMGPNSIRNASMMLTDGQNTRYPVNISEFTGDSGDIPIPSGNVENSLNVIEDSIKKYRSNIVVLGGDHLTTLGVLRGLKDTVKDKISIIHFDAHCDTWSNHFGQKYGHGTWLYNAIEEGIVDAKTTISIGIRSPADKKDLNYLSNLGGKTISAMSAMNRSPEVMSDFIKDHISKKPCYLSLDIDCLDPAFAPGTGTPEIGGLSTIWLKELITCLGQQNMGRKHINWVGMDCCEVAPAYDHAEITSLAAATFVWQYLSQNIYNDQ
jgi:agmatinase